MRTSTLLALAMLASSSAGARTPLGRYGSWSAFRDGGPPRCFATARPTAGGGGEPFAAFVAVRGTGVPVQLHIRLGRDPDAGKRATLVIDGRRIALMTAGREAWAADGHADARIVALARGGSRFEVKAVDARGRRFTDTYPLAGTASAIDAALLGCL